MLIKCLQLVLLIHSLAFRKGQSSGIHFIMCSYAVIQRDKPCLCEAKRSRWKCWISSAANTALHPSRSIKWRAMVCYLICLLCNPLGTTLHSATLHYTLLFYTALYYATLCYPTLSYATFHYAALHDAALHSATLHYNCGSSTANLNLGYLTVP